MKYKVGDKVRVRKDLVVGFRYGDDSFMPDMEKYLGKTMTIDKITRSGKYILKEDNRCWSWTDEMLKGVESINIIVDGNKVIAKRDGRVGIARCSPEDEFNIFTGVRLALDRLEEESKPYSWLKNGVEYYYPAPAKVDLFNYYPYQNDEVDKRLMSRDLIFRTKEEAIEAAKKMLAVLKES